MASRETWTARVSGWRASGLSSPAFCAGKDYTPGGLRYWASRLQHEGQPPVAVRVAKVVRVTGSSKSAAPQVAASGLVVEIGAARVEVPSGFDRATLGAVLELLGAGSAR